LKAVIQAGGKGTRLHPYTLALPKPLMPVGDQPVLMILLKWLRKWGVKNAYITTGYLGDLIQILCESINHSDMEISYSKEPEPLGTVGALRLLDTVLTDTFFTVNGDVICDMDLNAFYAFHKHRRSTLTVAVTRTVQKIDYGVFDCCNDMVTHFREKPKMNFTVSMGVYCMEPEILKYIPDGMPFGFDDLVHELLRQNTPIYLYPHDGFWLDIGREADYKLAQEIFLKEYKSSILGC